jgi:uncharacterized tellurite resistance protein B-like protein
MKDEAKKQLKPITIHQIRETLSRVIPEAYSKMILSDDLSIKRCNFIYVKLKYQKVERVIEKIKFPYYDSIMEKFAELEGGKEKFGVKSKLPSDSIFELLLKSYSKTGQEIINTDIETPFAFPFDIENSEIAVNQPKYFFPELSFKETCDQCYGNKYVNCNNHECNGRHTWTCTNCSGKGILNCEKCAGKKNVDCPKCKGTLRVKCKRCGGDGKINDGFLARTIFKKLVKEKKCGYCAGKGHVPCTTCDNGKIACTHCRGIGKVICADCGSDGTITCVSCYGDKERFGKINCPQCQTEGTTAQIVYVKTNVLANEYNKFIIEGQKLKLGEKQVIGHVLNEPNYELVYRKANNELFENYNEYSRIYAMNLEKELGLYKGEFPLLTKEELSYQVIPCVELSYRHTLTNTSHEITIIDFWNNPEILFQSEPEQLKRTIGNTAKTLKGSITKLLKTKAYKAKMDKRNEIVLLINLIKADGIIKDQEKVGLSEMIVNINEFTNAEKQKLFDLLNAQTLPELTNADVKFSTPSCSREVLDRLTTLAGADGEMAEAEKALIEKIKNMIETGMSKAPEKKVEAVG